MRHLPLASRCLCPGFPPRRWRTGGHWACFPGVWAITRNIDDDSLCCLPEQVCRRVGSGWIPCTHPPPSEEPLCTACSEQDKMVCWLRINGKQSFGCGTASVV